jgi:hypothetical protein
MNTSSVALILLIGGVMLVVGIRTIKYNKARDRAYQAYRKAVGILRTEFKDNLQLADKTRNEMTTGNISSERFSMKAWGEVLTEPFLAQMDEEASTDLRQIYHLIEEAEAYRSQLIESSNQQPWSGKPTQSRGDCLASLSRTLDELAANLQKHLARVSEDI